MAIYRRSKTRKNSRNYYDSYNGRIQSGPINRKLVLPFQRVVYTSAGYTDCQSSAALTGIAQIRTDTRPYAQARDRFFHAARDQSQASLGITLIEFTKSLDMVTSRARSLASSLNYLRKGDLYRSLRALAVDKRKSRKASISFQRSNKSLANLWLEMNFGWKPLIQDIYESVKVLQSNQPVTRISGTGKGTYEERVVVNNRPNYEVWTKDMLGVKTVRVVGDVRVTNPNLFLANKLGLTNPAAVLWDAIPFSFVVDWFLPVNKFLNSFDDSLGIATSGLCTSSKIQTMGSESYWNYTGTKRYTASTLMEFYRDPTTLPLPSFKDRMKPLDGSLWRAATSVALVSQLLGGIKLAYYVRQ